jgi:hypothetical protein
MPSEENTASNLPSGCIYDNSGPPSARTHRCYFNSHATGLVVSPNYRRVCYIDTHSPPMAPPPLLPPLLPPHAPPPPPPPPPPVFSLLASGSDQCVSPWQVIPSVDMCQAWYAQYEAQLNDGQQWLAMISTSSSSLQTGCTYHVTSSGNVHRSYFNTRSSGASTHASYRRVCYQ